MRRLAVVGAIVALGMAALGVGAGSATAAGPSRSCGKVGGTLIHAHSIGCGTARHVYKLNLSGSLPSGWTCSAAIGRCAKGELGSRQYLWWRPTA